MADTLLYSQPAKQMRGLDVFNAPSPVTPEMVVSGNEFLLVLFTISAADRLDPTKSVELAIFTSSDGGFNYTVQPVAAMRFVGSPNSVPGELIGLAVGAAMFVNKHLRIELNVPNRMSLGITACVTDTF